MTHFESPTASGAAPTVRRQPLEECIRRALDVTAALLGLVLLSPLLVLVALGVWVSGPGGVLFVQVRAGRSGAPFRLLKFRTMVRGAQALGRGLEVAPRDARITRLGAVLRRYGLDELPQLWNVLKGDMGLVGPRPVLPEQVAEYDRRSRTRLAVRPGLTGWAQIQGRTRLSWPQRIELDLEYLAGRSLWWDLAILLRTPLVLLKEPGTPRARLRLGWLIADVAVLGTGFAAAYLLRFEGLPPERYLTQMAWLLPGVVGVRAGLLLLSGDYQRIRRAIEMGELSGLAWVVLPVTLILLALRLWAAPDTVPMLKVPLGVVALDAALAGMGLLALRWPGRIPPAGSRPRQGALLIVGAGQLGERVARTVVQRPELGLHPVGFLDDDPTTHGRQLAGLPVLGPLEALSRVVAEQQVDRVALAIARPTPALEAEIRARCVELGVRLQRIPGVTDALSQAADRAAP